MIFLVAYFLVPPQDLVPYAQRRWWHIFDNPRHPLHNKVWQIWVQRTVATRVWSIFSWMFFSCVGALLSLSMCVYVYGGVWVQKLP